MLFTYYTNMTTLQICQFTVTVLFFALLGVSIALGVVVSTNDKAQENFNLPRTVIETETDKAPETIIETETDKAPETIIETETDKVSTSIMKTPLFIITLPRDAETRGFPVLESFVKIGFSNVQLISGVDGGAPENQADMLRIGVAGHGVAPTHPASSPGAPSDSQRGCTAAHLRAANRIINNQMEGAFILEDDAVPCLNFENFIQTMSNDELHKFDMTLFGHSTPDLPGPDRIVPSSGFCLHMYFMTLKGAQKMITAATTTPIDMPIDCWMNIKDLVDLNIGFVNGYHFGKVEYPMAVRPERSFGLVGQGTCFGSAIGACGKKAVTYEYVKGGR